MPMPTCERILLFIPAYRCEQQIVRVLRQLTPDIARHFAEVLVVDNRSPDGTQEAAKAGLRLIDRCTATLLCNDANYGLGGSHKVAFTYCLQKEYDAVVVLHGDDQAAIKDIMPLLRIGEHHKYDCLLGSRFASEATLEGYSLLRTCGNHVMNALFTLTTGKRVQDLGAGLNMYAADFLRGMPFSDMPDDLTFNVALLLATLFQKSKLRFFPITWREKDQVSNARLVRQTARTLRLLLRYMLRPETLASSHANTHTDRSYTSTILYSRTGQPDCPQEDDTPAATTRERPLCT